MIFHPHHQPVPGPRTLLSKDRGEIATALREHGLYEEAVTGILDFAELHGAAQTLRAGVTWDGTTWTAEMFGPRKGAA